MRIRTGYVKSSNTRLTDEKDLLNIRFKCRGEQILIIFRRHCSGCITRRFLFKLPFSMGMNMEFLIELNVWFILMMRRANFWFFWFNRIFDGWILASIFIALVDEILNVPRIFLSFKFCNFWNFCKKCFWSFYQIFES